MVVTLWQSQRTGWKFTDFQQELYYTCTCTNVGFSIQPCQVFIGGCVSSVLGQCHAPQQEFPCYFPVDWVATPIQPQKSLYFPPEFLRIDSQLSGPVPWVSGHPFPSNSLRWATHHDWKICNKTPTVRGPKGMPLLNTWNWIVNDLFSFWITCIQAVEASNSLYRFIAFWAHPHRLEVWGIFVWIKYCHIVV